MLGSQSLKAYNCIIVLRNRRDIPPPKKQLDQVLGEYGISISVVTSITFKSHAIPKLLVGGTLRYCISLAEEVIKTLRDFHKQKDENRLGLYALLHVQKTGIFSKISSISENRIRRQNNPEIHPYYDLLVSRYRLEVIGSSLRTTKLRECKKYCRYITYHSHRPYSGYINYKCVYTSERVYTSEPVYIIKCVYTSERVYTSEPVYIIKCVYTSERVYTSEPVYIIKCVYTSEYIHTSRCMH
ncbi:predicted protein [Nematostella vectensis]|uniref:Uncharacterized protein n=1 Tax=Nematostella vectensis TaxID=45351 RepID=A7SLT9_NEMVE|nr:predicted protein [Nematostella vectensis]|eukprot:XP_001627414.1 predicted protein [Nematostella vectensis]